MWEFVAAMGLLTAVGYWVFHPLFRPKPLENVLGEVTMDRAQMLNRSKEDVYAAIKEMEFDYRMGKLSGADYQELKSQYTAKAVEILKASDALASPGTDIDAVVEQEVQQIRKGKQATEQGDRTDDASWQLNFCPQCGGKVAQGQNFCQGCGVRLANFGGRN